MPKSHHDSYNTGRCREDSQPSFQLNWPSTVRPPSQMDCRSIPCLLAKESRELVSTGSTVGRASRFTKIKPVCVVLVWIENKPFCDLSKPGTLSK